MRRTAGRLADWVAAHEDVVLLDLAYTLARRRAHRPVRTAVIASSQSELTEALREVADGDTPYQAAVGQDDRGPVWVFSGQGSQWARMGASCWRPNRVRRHRRGGRATDRPRGRVLGDQAMTAPQIVTGIDRIQPTLFTMQVALAATMRSYGVRLARSSGIPSVRPRQPSSPEPCRWKTGCAYLPALAADVPHRRRRRHGIGGTARPASALELITRGVNDAVVAVASPQSTVIGGATQTVRDLVAAWEQRDVMAREIAVDVASHSPRSIRSSTSRRTRRAAPDDTGSSFYSATLYDPREQPVCDAGYWAHNLRHMVRFAPAVQAALEEGYRVFAELAPPPAAHACGRADQPVSTCRWPLWPACAANKRLPHGLRGLVADLHSAGAAVDFSVLYPNGRLVDAPLPTWTHRRLLLAASGQESQHMVVAPFRYIRCWARMCACRRNRSATSGRPRSAPPRPWLGDHRIRNVAVLPGAAYCEMALAAARAVLGEASEVRDIRFEQALLLDEQTTVGASAALSSPGVVDFTVETNQGGEQARQATAVLHPARGAASCAGHVRLLAAHPRREDGAEVRKRLDQRGVQYGPAFTGLAAVHTGEGATGTVLVEVALPAKSARNKMPTACTRRCWMPVFSPLRLIRRSRPLAKMCWRCRWVSGDSAPTVLPAAPATATHG